MLAIGRALTLNPRVLLLDEPMEGLAPIIVQELSGAIRRMVEDGGLALVLVEQHARLALELTAQAIVLERGRVVHASSSLALLADIPTQDRLLAVSAGATRRSITGISSMATKIVLAELARAYEAGSGRTVAIQSVGGVDAAKRVRAGEPFDVVVLARDAIEQLIAGGHLVAGSEVDLMRSGVAVAVRAGAPRPEIGSEDALKARGAGGAHDRHLHRPERRRARQAVRALGHRRASSGTGSSPRRPACRWAGWWRAARWRSASSSYRS